MSFWFEPTDSDTPPKYPYNRATVTESGHSQEFDDTPGNERIRTQHRSGSFQEYQATGNVVHKIVGNHYTIVAQDNNVTISGKCHITIYGDAEMEIQGDLYSRVGKGARINVEEDCQITTKGDTLITSDGVVNVVASEINLSAEDAVYIDGDLSVRGDINCQQTVSAFGNLNAGGHLGIQGSLNVLGGPTMADPLIPPLPHIITGLCPELGMIIQTLGLITASAAEGGVYVTSTLGPIAISSPAAPILITSGPMVAITTAITKITSITSITGVTSIVGATSITGVTSIQGATNITGVCIATGDIRAGGGSTGLLTHIHPTAMGPTGPGKG